MLVSVAAIVLVWLHLGSERKADLQAARRATANLSQSIAQHVAGRFDSADAGLIAIVDDLARGVPIDSAALARRVDGMPSVRDVMVLDAGGGVLASSKQRSRNDAGQLSRVALARHAADDSLGAFVGPPGRSMIDRAWQIGISRRVDVEGRFAGIVLAHIDLAEIGAFLGRFDLGNAGAIVLASTAGQVIVRHPYVDSLVGSLGALPALQLDAAARAGTRDVTLAIDGVRRMTGWQMLDRYPLIVAVGLSRDEVLANWRGDAMLHLGASGALMLLASGVAAWLTISLRRMQAAERRAASIAADFRLLAESSTDIVSRISLDGVRRYVSPASLEILGFSPGELVGTPAAAFVHPWDRDRVQAQLHGVRKGAEATACSVHRVRHKRGHWVWIELAMRCRRASDGSVMDYVSSARDVTARQEAQEALAREEARHRLLSERTSDLIIRLDGNMRRTHVGPRCLPMLGFTQAEMLASKPRALVHPDDWARVEAGLAASRLGGAAGTTTSFRGLRKDGSEIWIEVTSTHLVEDDGFVSVLRDITARKLAELRVELANARLDRLARHLGRARDRAEAANQAKSRFVTSMSHELRTPLHGMMGHAQLLRLEGGLNPAQDSRVEALLAAGRHLMAMINDVLDLAQVEADRIVLSPAECDLAVLAAACLDLVRPAAAAKALSLSLDVAVGPGPVWADSTRLRQVVINLLANAVKFTPAGRVVLRVRPRADGRVRFEVEDTGPGVAEADRERLFVQFERKEGETAEGAGLGLALSAKLVALMGGEIGVEAPPSGQGSVFWFEAPLPPARAAEAAAPSTADAVRRRRRVLVVDDVPVNRDIARAFLAAAGHEVRCVDCGEDALTAAAGEPFDIVLMDVRMPGIGGLEATRRLRAMPNVPPGLPVVALTAQAFPEQVEACRAAGMTGHLLKPFEPATLLRKIEEMTAAVEDSAFDQGAHDHLATIMDRAELDEHLEELRGRAADLLQCLAGCPAPAAAAMAHELAGSVGLFGYRALSAAAGAFEHACAQGDAAPERATLQKELTRFLEAAPIPA